MSKEVEDSKKEQEDSARLLISELFKGVLYLVKENKSPCTIDTGTNRLTVKHSELSVPRWMFWVDPVKVHLKRLLKAEEDTMQEQRNIVIKAHARYQKAAEKAAKLRKILETM